MSFLDFQTDSVEAFIAALTDDIALQSLYLTLYYQSDTDGRQRILLDLFEQTKAQKLESFIQNNSNHTPPNIEN